MALTLQKARHVNSKQAKEMYREYYPTVFGYFYSRLRGDTDSAQELAQDVFVTMLRKLRTLDWQRPQAMLLHIAHDRLVDYIRWRGHAALTPAPSKDFIRAMQSLERADLPVAILEKKETGLWIQQILSLLRPGYQRLLTAHYIDGHSLSHLAERDQLSPKAVKSKLERARKAFAKRAASSKEIDRWM